MYLLFESELNTRQRRDYPGDDDDDDAETETWVSFNFDKVFPLCV